MQKEGIYALDTHCYSRGFVASGVQFSHRGKSHPLAACRRGGSPDLQPVYRTQARSVNAAGKWVAQV